MIYELRVYDTIPGKLPALVERFTDHTIGYFQKHGIKVIGLWTDAIGTSNRLTYIVAFEDADHRDRAWAACLNDPGLREVFAESERDGPLIRLMTNTILRPIPGSPLQ
jgi:hypothetical protein